MLFRWRSGAVAFRGSNAISAAERPARVTIGLLVDGDMVTICSDILVLERSTRDDMIVALDYSVQLK